MIVYNILWYWFSGYRYVYNGHCLGDLIEDSLDSDSDIMDKCIKGDCLSSAISTCNAHSECRCVSDMCGWGERFQLKSSSEFDFSICGNKIWVKIYIDIRKYYVESITIVDNWLNYEITTFFTLIL